MLDEEVGETISRGEVERRKGMANGALFPDIDPKALCVLRYHCALFPSSSELKYKMKQISSSQKVSRCGTWEMMSDSGVLLCW